MIRFPWIALTVAAFSMSAPAFPGQADHALPVNGQPAADVLASRDAWGNPTFIGGLTNSGPDSHSVW